LVLDISIAIWTIISFLLLLFLLNTFLFKPISKFMDDRNRRIAEGLKAGEDAKKAKVESQKQIEEDIRSTGAEAKQIVADAKSADEAERSKMLENARSEAAGVMKEIQSRVNDEEEKTYAEVKSRMPELVSALAGKLLGDSNVVAENSVVISNCISKVEE